MIYKIKNIVMFMFVKKLFETFSRMSFSILNEVSFNLVDPFRHSDHCTVNTVGYLIFTGEAKSYTNRLYSNLNLKIVNL